MLESFYDWRAYNRFKLTCCVDNILVLSNCCNNLTPLCIAYSFTMTFKLSMHESVKIIPLAIASRLVVLLFSGTIQIFTSPYDTSAQLLQPTRAVDLLAFDKLVYHWCAALANWDGAYFTHIAESGYRTEQFYAFFPFLPWLLRLVS